MASSPNYLFLYLITPLNISPLLTKRKVLMELTVSFFTVSTCWFVGTLKPSKTDTQTHIYHNLLTDLNKQNLI